MNIEREIQKINEGIKYSENRIAFLERIMSHEYKALEWHYQADDYDAIFQKAYRGHSRNMGYCHDRCANRLIKIYENTKLPQQ